MNAGQLMMFQMPTGAGLSSAKSAPATVAGTSKEGQNETDFAGMLSEMSPVPSGQPVIVSGVEKSGGLGAPETVRQVAAGVKQRVKPDVVAMLLAAMGNGTQLNATDAPTAKASQEKSDTEVPSDTPTSQDAGQGASATQIATPDVLAMLLAATGTGNQLPVVNAPTIGDAQENPAEMIQMDVPKSQDVTLSAAGMQLVPSTQTDGRTPETDAAGQQVGGTTQGNSQSGKIEAMIALMNNADDKTDGVVIEKMPSQQLPGTAPLQQQGMTQVAVVSTTSSPEMVALQQTVSVLPETMEPVSKASSAASDSTTAAQTPKVEAGGKAEPLPSVSAQGTSAVPANGAAGQIAGVTAVITPSSTDKLADSDIGKEVLKPHETVVAHSSTAETVIAGNQKQADHTQEKVAGRAENNANSSAAMHVGTAKNGLGDGTGSGSMGKKSDESMPKPAETLTNVTQQVVGGHQTSPTSTPLQPVQAEAARAENHEQVARQVQEQLTNHTLKPGNDQITFKLSPDNLGDIKVNLSLEDHHLKVEIVTETNTARDSLLQHVDSLKESLSRQNISIDKFNVTTGGGGGAGNQANHNAQAWSQLAQSRQAPQWLLSGGYRTPLVETVPLTPMYVAQTEHAMVDLHF
jgi:flagellar hook-length control protein FliK